ASSLFLQGADGIRGVHVTGVQTCALPISSSERYLAIECDAIICGSLFADAGVRDVDWYRFDLEAPGLVAIALTAELPASLFLFPDRKSVVEGKSQELPAALTMTRQSTGHT